ncbi:MAG: hypothetical protein KatS3mg001_072 [Candidatus Pacearchaeota archaeon]|nr:MAG: hypothetical protein KatS3mg001_072 [Candidatus Pacearchaeota archaeon]
MQKDNNIKQEQIHNLLFNREIGWQEIIYDLINTEQLDPWDVDIVYLTDKYLEKIKELEETDFFISSKVLLAAAILLRIKAEFLLNKHIKSIDEILFPKEKSIINEKSNVLEISLEDKEEIPEIIPKSPLPRVRKVTLNELIEALSKAIKTENRRIKREIIKKRANIEISFVLPKKSISIKNKIIEIYQKVIESLKKEQLKKISFNEFVGKEADKEERLINFVGLLHLDHQKKLWLEQEIPFEDFYIWLSETYFKENTENFDFSSEVGSINEKFKETQ